MSCVQLRPFQRRFLKGALAPGISTAAMSLARAVMAKVFWLAGHLISRILHPADELFRPGTESVLCASNVEQARIVFRFARETLEPSGEYRFLDSVSRIGIVHKANEYKRLRVISSSSGKSAMGLVGTPWAVCDEAGSWEIARWVVNVGRTYNRPGQAWVAAQKSF